MSPLVNSWRKSHGMQALSYRSLEDRKYPLLYMFSEAVVPKPRDWDSTRTLTGAWDWDEKPNGNVDYNLPEGLKDFIEMAKKDEKKIVSVGFGSVHQRGHLFRKV